MSRILRVSVEVEIDALLAECPGVTEGDVAFAILQSLNAPLQPRGGSNIYFWHGGVDFATRERSWPL